ncbi:MAG: hypothetical protein PHC75_00310 [Burkholderiales bacterium]|nr:hypothetical protein [Burkholderiales bacterium]
MKNNLLSLFIMSAFCLVSCSNNGSAATQIQGIVQSGVSTESKQVLSRLTVNLYAIGESSAQLISQTSSNNSGQFIFNLPSSAIESMLYITASNGESIELASIIGNYSSSKVVVNELTTVAAAYSMAQFWHGDSIYGSHKAITVANGMNLNLVSPYDGSISTVISSPPNANQTNALRLINSLANAVANCVRNKSTCDTLFQASRTISGALPNNTLMALQNLVLNPSQGINEIFNYSHRQSIYSPYLYSAPDAWTLALKFNQTGSSSCPFGGPGNITFDDNGNAWITNNVVQGSTVSSNCIIVLKPNGMPADGTNGSPASPLFGGGIFGQGFGITTDLQGRVWSGNFGWGTLLPTGSVSLFSSNGEAISGESGYSQYIYRAQALRADNKDNMWIASNGNQRLVIFPSGNPDQAIYATTAESYPFDIEITQEDDAWVSFSSLTDPSVLTESSGVVSKYKLVNKQIQQIATAKVGGYPLGMTLDSSNYLWVSSLLESAVYRVSPDGQNVESFSGGGTIGTWNVTLDGDENVYAVNFMSNQTGLFGIAKLCGPKVRNCPPGATLGTPISPNTGYTLPTGGDQVLLADGTPLNGPDAPADYKPLMRMVAAKIDIAGNLWVTNNWKPSFIVDLDKENPNPGGDGVVIFVGLATPNHQ